MNATAMEYTIIIVSTKAVKSVQEHFNGLDNREWAERHAEGIARGCATYNENIRHNRPIKRYGNIRKRTQAIAPPHWRRATQAGNVLLRGL